MQRCTSAEGRCKSGKAEAEAEKITEYRVRITEGEGEWLAGVWLARGVKGGSAKVQIGRRPVQRWKGGGREDCRVRRTEYGLGGMR